VRKCGKLPEHKSSVPQITIDISKQGLTDINRVEFHLYFESTDRRERLLSTAQDVQFRALRIQLDKVDLRNVVCQSPFDQSR
jgi:hypothetical protein